MLRQGSESEHISGRAEPRDLAEGDSGDIETFLTEATSKEDLLWWLNYFERANQEK